MVIQPTEGLAVAVQLSVPGPALVTLTTWLPVGLVSAIFLLIANMFRPIQGAVCGGCWTTTRMFAWCDHWLPVKIFRAVGVWAPTNRPSALVFCR